MQVQFLPFHSSFITWTQRIALLVDLVLLGWLWRKVLSGRELGGPFRASWVWPVVGFALSLGMVLFSWTVATFPGEWQESVGWLANHASEQSERKDGIGGRFRGVSLHDWVFNSEIDLTTRRRRLPFSNTLVLTGFNVLKASESTIPRRRSGGTLSFAPAAAT